MSRRGSQLGKALAGVALGCLGLSLVPMYGKPFVGCESSGWLALTPGCSHWPEAFRGFLFVFPISLLASARASLPLGAMLFLLVLSLLGGLEPLKGGETFGSNPLANLPAAFAMGYPVLAGGALGLLPWVWPHRPAKQTVS